MSIFLGIKKGLMRVFGRLRSIPNYPVEASALEREIMEQCKPFTLTSYARLWATVSSAKYVIENNIQGAFVECGVWRGGSAMAMARTLLSKGIDDRAFFLYDTFCGMTKPSEPDRDLLGVSAETQMRRADKDNPNSIWAKAAIEDVMCNIQNTGYPDEMVTYVKGDVIDTLSREENLPDEIALLRLDTDWYESTKQELNVLFPRLVRGGVCIVDDFGHWEGARKALTEYFEVNGIYPLLHVSDYTGRVFLKT